MPANLENPSIIRGCSHIAWSDQCELKNVKIMLAIGRKKHGISKAAVKQ